MSLLDDVSIVVTPNGYKAGELYAVIPVPTLGSELLTNEDFSNGLTGWGTQIPSGQTVEVISNQLHIDYDSTGTQGSTGVYQSILTSGNRYTTTIDVASVTGTFKVQVGSVSHAITTSGIKTFTNVASSNTIYIVRQSNSTSFEATINSVSVKEYTAGDMDVTRATAATRVDENGLVNYAEVIGGEEVTNSDFSGGSTGWTVNNSDADNYVVFDGSTARLKFLNTSPVTEFKTTDSILTSGKTYKLTVDIALATSGGVKVDGNGISETFNSVGVNERIITPTGNAPLTFYRATANVDLTFNSVSVKEVTRDNVPRIDYTGGGCPHILAEPQRTNVNTYSEDFSQSFYIKDSGVSVGTTNNVSPSGEFNATQIEVDNNLRIYANTASDTYASSWYIKAGTFSYFRSGGNIDLVAGTYSGGTIQSVGNGWFRITKAYTGNRPFQIQAYPDGTYSSHTTSGNYYIWGSQIEVGSYATSYIPTSGSTVTRNQDLFSRDGIGSLINSEEGTFFAEMAALSDDGTNRALSLCDGTNSNRMLIYFSAGTNAASALYTYGGSTQVAITHTLSDSTEFIKCAFKFKENDCAFWINGVEVGTDTSTTAFSANTLNDLNFDSGVGGSPFHGKVKQLQVYKTALTDEQLLQLTGESGTDFYESYAEMASALTYTIQ